MTPRTAVVHLARGANGLAPLRAFLTSYDAFDAGAAHDLVVVYKGFANAGEARALVGERASTSIELDDRGLDLTAYVAAARRLPHERLCFLNSYSEVLATDWLARFDEALAPPGVGLVGATGSWGSHRSFALHLLRLPNPYSELLADRAVMGSAFRSLGPPLTASRTRQRLKALHDLPREIVGYEGFPAPHIRTNAFMLHRSLLLEIAPGKLDTKSRAYRFEGGRRGLTGLVGRRGLRSLVVGRSGGAESWERWPERPIFWQGDQAELLVGDNQTRAYQEGTEVQRTAMSRYAWGERAAPAPR